MPLMSARWLGLAVALGCACAGRHELPAPSMPLVVTPDAPFRTTQPAPHEAGGEAAWIPEITEQRLENGLMVWVVSRPSSTSMVAGLVFPDAGATTGADPTELLRLTARMLRDGGTRGPAQAVSYGSWLNGSLAHVEVGLTTARISIRGIAGTAPEAIEILAAMVRSPVFDPQILDFAKVDELIDLQSRSNTLTYLSQRIALENVFGDDTADRVLGSGDDALRAYDIEAVKACYARAFRPEGAVLVIVGAVDPKLVLDLAAQRFGDWRPAAPPPAAPRKKSKPRAAGGLRLNLLGEDLGDQADLLLVQPGPAATQDGLAFELLATAAAGSLLSRVNLRLRHDQGMTYGVNAKVLRGKEFGLFLMGGTVDVGLIVTAVKTMLEILADLQRTPLDGAELAAAKAVYRSRRVGSLVTNDAFFAEAAEAFGRSESLAESLRTFDARLDAIGPQEVLDAAQRYLRPKDVEIVAAGDELAARRLWSLGPVEYYRSGKGYD